MGRLGEVQIGGIHYNGFGVYRWPLVGGREGGGGGKEGREGGAGGGGSNGGG